jgi:putative restriction endonuclease
MAKESAKLRAADRLAWLLLEFGEDRQYAGNEGYADERRKMYAYDSFVPNHLNVQVGDLVLLADKEFVVGAARVSTIRTFAKRKRRLRCPKCSTTGLKRRITLRPVFRCNNRHTFDRPRIELADCTEFRARYGETYLDFLAPIPMREIRQATARGSQLAIRAVDLSKAASRLRRALPLGRLLP